MYDILKNIDISKATGPDGVSPRLLREGKHILTPILTNFFNLSLKKNIFPHSWKIANVTPIFKKGNKHLCSNYRPISLLSILSKVFEKAVFNHLFSFLENKISPFQFGFLPGKSTVIQLLDIYFDIIKALDDGKEIFFVFFDISKAFDRVWHRGLLAKLEHYGIQGNILRWVANYLSDRQQRVVLNGHKSRLRDIYAGVPQGSVLGPLLFLIYINDLPIDIINNVRLFADDTCLYVISDRLDNFITLSTLQVDLKTIEIWARKWLVDFNASKTVSLLISRRRSPTDITVAFDKSTIVQTDSHKHLGITLSTDGSWGNHIKNLLASANSKLSIFRGLKFVLDRKCLEIMFKSFMRPSLEYADIVWDNMTDINRNRLEYIQKEALRVITGLTRSASDIVLYEESGFLKLETRRLIHRLSTLYSIHNSENPHLLTQRLPLTAAARNPYLVRNPFLFTPFFCKTESFRRSFFPQTVRDWNSLPHVIRTAQNLSTFKKKLFDLHQCPIPPCWFYTGQRIYNILLCRLRCGCSSLSADLFSNHLSDSARCRCGFFNESASHFLLQCRLFHQFRDHMLKKIINFGFNGEITVALLMYGCETLPTKTNLFITDCVLCFIKETKRFTT